MEYKKKINARLPLITALLLLEQLALTVRIYSAKIKIDSTEAGCNNCKLRNIKAIKKALSDCCTEKFYDEAQIEAEVEYNDIVEMILQAFRLRYVAEVQ